MRDYEKKRSLTGVAALLVFAVFAVGVLMTLLGGAGIYERLTGRSAQSYDSRTCTQYLAARVRQAPGEIAVESFGGGDALVLEEKIGDLVYVTRVYCHDGWLMELFSLKNGSFAPEDGTKLLPAEFLKLQLQEGLLTADISCGGVALKLKLAVRTGEGAQP